MTSTETEKKKPRNMVEFRQYEGAIYAENLDKKYTTINEPEREVKFILGPRGKDDSITVLPPRALDVAGFRRLVQQGKVRLSVDVDEMEAKIEQLSGSAYAANEARHQELMSSLGPSNSENDLVKTQCLISKKEIYVNAKENDMGVPPLAPEFKHRAGEFIGTKVYGDNGQPKFVFSRITQ